MKTMEYTQEDIDLIHNAISYLKVMKHGYGVTTGLDYVIPDLESIVETWRTIEKENKDGFVDWNQYAEFDKIRNDSNAEIIRRLTNYLTDFPTIRFHQALVNLRITTTGDLYNEEPSVTLRRMKGSVVK